MITHNECTFSANDGKTHGWQRKEIYFFVLMEKGEELWCQISSYLFLDLIYFSFSKMNKIKLLNAMVFQVRKLWKFWSTGKIIKVIRME